MDLVQRIHRRALICLVPAAVLSALIEWWRVPAGVMAGGLLGLLNIRGLAWGVRGMLGEEKIVAKMIFFSQFRLIMLFIIISLLVYLKLANIFGVFAGLSIVFAVILIEGYRNSGNTDKSDS